MKTQTKTAGKTATESVGVTETHLSYGDTINRNLSLSVLQNGATFIDLHRCEEVRVKHEKAEEWGGKSDTTTIEMRCEGKWVIINLFLKGNKEKGVEAQ